MSLQLRRWRSRRWLGAAALSGSQSLPK